MPWQNSDLKCASKGEKVLGYSFDWPKRFGPVFSTVNSPNKELLGVTAHSVQICNMYIQESDVLQHFYHCKGSSAGTYQPRTSAIEIPDLATCC